MIYLKAFFDHIGQSDIFENLSSLIGLKRGNDHFCHDFSNVIHAVMKWQSTLNLNQSKMADCPVSMAPWSHRSCRFGQMSDDLVLTDLDIESTHFMYNFHIKNWPCLTCAKHGSIHSSKDNNYGWPFVSRLCILISYETYCLLAMKFVKVWYPTKMFFTDFFPWFFTAARLSKRNFNTCYFLRRQL